MDRNAWDMRLTEVQTQLLTTRNRQKREEKTSITQMLFGILALMVY